MGKGVSEGTVLCYIVPLREADCLSVFSSPPASPVRLALPVRHLPRAWRGKSCLPRSSGRWYWGLIKREGVTQSSLEPKWVKVNPLFPVLRRQSSIFYLFSFATWRLCARQSVYVRVGLPAP